MIQVIERPITLDYLYDLDGLDTKLHNIHGESLVRFVVEGYTTSSSPLYCSINCIQGLPNGWYPGLKFSPQKHKLWRDDKFRAALVIPTGLGASVGGHNGDAGAIARLMASVCDELITHPNVVNASDFNEMTDNTLYVEGYSLTDYLCGNIGLRKVRQNRVLVVVDGSANQTYIDAAINVVNAARVTYGFNCPEVVVLKDSWVMATAWSEGDRASGIVTNLDGLFKLLEDRKGIYDAVALTSPIITPEKVRKHYYKNGGVNPWGGVEAMLTHAVSCCFHVPCAHAPMMESKEVELEDYGVIDPRDGAEMVSVTYLPCILKGLNRAPQIIADGPDVSCLVIPQRCLGVPMMAAWQRGIPIIAVDDDLKVGNVRCTDHGPTIMVDNYLEAVGVVAALKAGISVESLRRPLPEVTVTGGKV